MQPGDPVGTLDPAAGAAAARPGVRRAVALGIFVCIAVAGLLASSGSALLKAIHLLAFAVAFLVPALRIAAPADLMWRWRFALGSVLGATFAWDAATALVAGTRPFLGAWPVVYGTSLLFFGALLWLHAVLASLLARRHRRRGS